ncbi:PEPxxWA-CTERM sorting domain-containing protein [Phenylobacterium sp. LH3H17]|uniref:PEPxxWA-CTERM sorting domain-containing protein n=1 Tax=Phenylobacterium sp. LH3H17 TaxID=2903901 RepID=UPI0020C9C02F|nr:PEPxxWA-CTERM sorting domain-containing protein [Phenylobacterium sp. LH3H17]UTP41180.1 PEPxxWA-CTERM sorting domain-containing protein [Phenylobacterium sp. LH3H17]
MRKFGSLIVFAAAMTLASTPALTAETLRVTLDTSGVFGTLGTVTFEFGSPLVTGPGSFNATGTATITNFLTDGSLMGASGGGYQSGGLPGVLTLSDQGDGTTSLYSRGQVFGSFNRFDLTLDSGVFCPTTATNCSRPTFNLYLNGVPQFQASLDRNGVGVSGTRLVSLSPVSSAVPEPATWGMMIVGFAAVGASIRRRPRLATI